jgi:hypothetical protein
MRREFWQRTTRRTDTIYGSRSAAGGTRLTQRRRSRHMRRSSSPVSARHEGRLSRAALRANAATASRRRSTPARRRTSCWPDAARARTARRCDAGSFGPDDRPCSPRLQLVRLQPARLAARRAHGSTPTSIRMRSCRGRGRPDAARRGRGASARRRSGRPRRAGLRAAPADERQRRAARAPRARRLRRACRSTDWRGVLGRSLPRPAAARGPDARRLAADNAAVAVYGPRIGGLVCVVRRRQASSVCCGTFAKSRVPGENCVAWSTTPSGERIVNGLPPPAGATTSRPAGTSSTADTRGQLRAASARGRGRSRRSSGIAPRTARRGRPRPGTRQPTPGSQRPRARGTGALGGELQHAGRGNDVGDWTPPGLPPHSVVVDRAGWQPACVRARPTTARSSTGSPSTDVRGMLRALICRRPSPTPARREPVRESTATASASVGTSVESITELVRWQQPAATSRVGAIASVAQRSRCAAGHSSVALIVTRRVARQPPPSSANVSLNTRADACSWPRADALNATRGEPRTPSRTRSASPIRHTHRTGARQRDRAPHPPRRHREPVHRACLDIDPRRDEVPLRPTRASFTQRTPSGEEARSHNAGRTTRHSAFSKHSRHSRRRRRRTRQARCRRSRVGRAVGRPGRLDVWLVVLPMGGGGSHRDSVRRPPLGSRSSGAARSLRPTEARLSRVPHPGGVGDVCLAEMIEEYCALWHARDQAGPDARSNPRADTLGDRRRCTDTSDARQPDPCSLGRRRLCRSASRTDLNEAATNAQGSLEVLAKVWSATP